MIKPPHALAAALALSTATPALAAEDGEQIRITGEFIDTWCYFSGVMGGPEAVTGSAHHTCALWCSAGGIPVGLLTPEGEIYLVLKVEGDDNNTGGELMLSMASSTIVADGTFYERDGLNYIVVEEIVENLGIINLTHENVGVTPGFAVPPGER